jgi:hypothetical protein
VYLVSDSTSVCLSKHRARLEHGIRERAETERLEQLRQMGFVNVDKWRWSDRIASPKAEDQEQELLAVLRNDPQATRLE